MAAFSFVDGTLNPALGLRTYIVIFIVLIWSAYQAARYFSPQPLVTTPLLLHELDKKSRAQRWFSDCRSIMQSAYRLFQQGLPMVRVTVEDGSELVILSHRYLEELKSIPDSILSFEEGLTRDLLSEYSHLKLPGPIGQNAIRSDLTPGLPRLMHQIAFEAANALKTHFPQDDSWVPVNIFQVSLNAVTQVSARLFVGQELCRDDRWLQCSQTATNMAFKVVGAMKRWPAWLRPIVHRFIPEVVALEKARAEGTKLLMEAAAARQMSGTEVKEDFLLEWVGRKNPSWAKDHAAQADLQLQLSIAAIHTTTNALTHLLFDLATHTEYIKILRQEVEEALAETGGVYNKECMAKMLKTDSFMKESQRMHPPALTTFKRRTKKELKLSDGTFIPKGTSIEVDASARYNDPNVWQNPEQFDGLRFLRLRETTQNKGHHQFVSSNTDYLFWGLGKHSCPGRFFAANEIKTLLAMFLLNYDMVLPKDCTGRPADVSVGSMLNANPSAQVLVKRLNSGISTIVV